LGRWGKSEKKKIKLIANGIINCNCNCLDWNNFFHELTVISTRSSNINAIGSFVASYINPLIVTKIIPSMVGGGWVYSNLMWGAILINGTTITKVIPIVILNAMHHKQCVGFSCPI
jgi:hypothetical protein